MPLLQHESSRAHVWPRGLRNDQRRGTAAMVRTHGRLVLHGLPVLAIGTRRLLMIERRRIERQRRPDGPLVQSYSACAELIVVVYELQRLAVVVY